MSNVNPPDVVYHTRRGMRTAHAAAEECMQSAVFSLIFLQENFAFMGKNAPPKVEFSDVAVQGLSCIIDNIIYDATEARDFYLGDSDAPAKIRGDIHER